MVDQAPRPAINIMVVVRYRKDASVVLSPLKVNLTLFSETPNVTFPLGSFSPVPSPGTWQRNILIRTPTRFIPQPLPGYSSATTNHTCTCCDGDGDGDGDGEAVACR